jgi:hypothetical protein
MAGGIGGSGFCRLPVEGTAARTSQRSYGFGWFSLEDARDQLARSTTPVVSQPRPNSSRSRTFGDLVVGSANWASFRRKIFKDAMILQFVQEKKYWKKLAPGAAAWSRHPVILVLEFSESSS